tara:strand:+ start:1593 stop:2204 length:612 start_codon:yes stop_codon:yes gene_type:complete
MTANRKLVQLTLVAIGLFLILATYFLYPKITEQKFTKKQILEDESVSIEEEATTSTKKDETNTFKNVEYSGLYDVDNTFTVKSEKAYILKEDQDIVHMSNMLVTLYLNDGRIVTITSDRGSYNKVTYDCFFVDNVKATDGETVVLSDNLDLLSTEDSASVYNNVVITANKGTLHADKVEYNFETKYYQVSMYNNEKVKVKIIK